MVDPPESTSAEAPNELRVTISLPAADLTDRERAWMLAHPVEGNALLRGWYSHARRCRRAARQRGGGPLERFSECRCGR